MNFFQKNIAGQLQAGPSLDLSFLSGVAFTLKINHFRQIELFQFTMCWKRKSTNKISVYVAILSLSIELTYSCPLEQRKKLADSKRSQCYHLYSLTVELFSILQVSGEKELKNWQPKRG